MKFFTPIILLAASFGIFFWVVSPRYEKIKADRLVLASKEQSLSQARDAGVKWDNLISKSQSFSQPNVDLLSQFLPDKVNTIHFIVNLNALAAKYNIQVKNIRISTASDKNADGTIKSYGTNLISFSVSTSYDNFLKFARELEKSLELVDFSSVSFRPSDTSTTYDYNITLKTYWLK